MIKRWALVPLLAWGCVGGSDDSGSSRETLAAGSEARAVGDEPGLPGPVGEADTDRLYSPPPRGTGYVMSRCGGPLPGGVEDLALQLGSRQVVVGRLGAADFSREWMEEATSAETPGREVMRYVPVQVLGGEHLDGRPYPRSTLWLLDPDGSYYEDMEHRRHYMRGPPEHHPIRVATDVWSTVALLVEEGEPGLVREMYPVEADHLVIGTVRLWRADLVSALAATDPGGAR